MQDPGEQRAIIQGLHMQIVQTGLVDVPQQHVALVNMVQHETCPSDEQQEGDHTHHSPPIPRFPANLLMQDYS